MAFALAKRGHRVFATARNPSKIPSELAVLSVVTTLELDVTSTESVSKAVDAVARATEQGLDVLVNNAGAGYTMPLLDVDIEEAQRLFDANIWGSLRTTQGFSELLIAAKGRVFNVSSVGAFVNTPWLGKRSSLYC